jgi:hypothetical protein
MSFMTIDPCFLRVTFVKYLIKLLVLDGIFHKYSKRFGIAY